MPRARRRRIVVRVLWTLVALIMLIREASTRSPRPRPMWIRGWWRWHGQQAGDGTPTTTDDAVRARITELMGTLAAEVG